MLKFLQFEQLNQKNHESTTIKLNLYIHSIFIFCFTLDSFFSYYKNAKWYTSSEKYKFQIFFVINFQSTYKIV